MLRQQLVILGGASFSALLGACALKRAWNYGKEKNVHTSFTFGQSEPLDKFDALAQALSLRYRQLVLFEIHFLEMDFQSEVELHPLVDALAKKKHKIGGVFEHLPERLNIWRRVIELTEPKQETVLAGRVSELIPSWGHAVNGVTDLARSADQALDGMVDALAGAAKAVCEAESVSQKRLLNFLSTICPPSPDSPYDVFMNDQEMKKK